MKYFINIRAILVVAFMLFLPTMMWADKEPWVEYLDGTLTFHYDENRSKSNNSNNYSLPEAGEDPGWLEVKESVKKVVFDESFKDARPKRCAKWFYDQTNLGEIEGLENLNTSEVNDMSYMFAYCKNLSSIDLSSFNTSRVTTMTHMFYDCTWTTSINVTSFNTSNVDDMSYMFGGCSYLTELDLTSFNTRNVTNMSHMFYSDDRLASIKVYGYFVKDKVTSSDDMFWNCEELPNYNIYVSYCNHYDASNIKRYMTYLTSQVWVEYQDSTKTLRFRNDHMKDSVTATAKYALPEAGIQPEWIGQQVEHVVFDNYFSYVIPKSCFMWFYRMKDLTDITGLENLYTSEVTDMSNMFDGCTSLTSLDLSSFHTDSVTTMSSMFDGCTSLTSVDLSSFNTEKVTDLSYMFRGCSMLPTLDLTSFVTKKVKDTRLMFTTCEQLTRVLVSSRFVTDQVTESTMMFYGCTNLPSYVSDSTDIAKAKDYLSYLPSLPWVEYQKDSLTLTFHYDDLKPYATATAKYDLPEEAITPGWLAQKEDITKVVFSEKFKDARPKRCTKWFYELEKLTDIQGIEYLCTDSVTDMSFMFAYCPLLKELDLSHFNTAQVTTTSHMFQDCMGLTSLDFSSFDTQNVTDMSHMFNGCRFKDLNLTYFDTKNVKNMRQMFYICTWLCRVTVSSRFVTDQVTESTLMFFGCNYLPSYEEDSVDKESAKVYLTYLPSYPWVEYQAETNSLRFRYDDLKPFVTATAKYDLPTTGSPGWVKHVDADRVTIDKSFKEVRPVSCHEWFYAQQKITEIEGLENLCTDSVTTMEEMFYLCTHLEKLDLSGFNTERVTTMNSMFYLCRSLTDVQVRSFNTEKVTDMGYMFLDCRKLKEIDLTSFDTKNVTNMNAMFNMINHETNLEHIYVSEKFVTDQLRPYYNLFFDCEKLPNYVYGKFDKAAAHYKEGGYLTLRRQFSVGEAQYNVDDYVNPTCYTDVDFTDGAAYSSPTDFTFATTNYATYTRKVSNHWATLCLPFAFSAKDDSPSRFYSIESYTNGSIVVKQFTDTIPAGTPVLAYVTGDELNVSAVGTAAVTTPVADDELQGVFTQTEVPITDYFISNDRFWSVFWLRMYNGNVKHVYVSPYRAYLTLGDIPPYESKPDSIGITEDAVTGVIDPSVSLRQDTDLSSFLDGAELYDLEGRRLTAPKRGMMIIRKNGVSRKVVIK